MGDYTINLTFKKEQISEMNNGGFKLCFTSGVGSDTNFNVVAYSSTISSSVKIFWKEQYQLAATKDQFSSGVKFTVSTTAADIKYKDVYTLPPDWNDGTISQDATIDPTSFRFVNGTADTASAVVYKVIQGKPTPFYISQSPVFSKGNETLTPKLKVALWFQKDAETGTMFSKNSTAITAIDFTNQMSWTGTWNGSSFVAS
ncbi:hypothetical protein K491DRAFT_745119 [Lophiostoma macrostomum CBS 122681]|uniref:Uncharacterized protein n=1 Tax=Lophiostoma macrostomum CBS 122681 TaxID=1314788 RepID=A0A6A6T8Y0_9PLEO|nr:hypothetical protein K491DRAFT_745119 [Lophiostoma macrostomum CBS 122681]